MFIIDFRNKLVSDYRFSVIGNSNVDKVDLVSHFTQYASGYSIYLKVRSDDERYVDKIAIASENVEVDEDVLVCRWTMGAVSTQCKKLYLQLQFEQGENIIAQSRIVSVVLGDTINVDELIPVIYPQVLKELQLQIDTLKAESVAIATMGYANDVLTLTLKNKASTTLSVLEVSIPLSDKYTKSEIDLIVSGLVAKITSANKVYATNNNGEQIGIDVDYGSTFQGKIVRRSGDDEQIYVPLTPTANGHAVSKYYLEQLINEIEQRSDVVDVVGTYADLEAYDTSHLSPNSLIKVINDETHDNEITYYRWVVSGGVGAWVYVASEGAYYTTSQIDLMLADYSKLAGDNQFTGDNEFTKPVKAPNAFNLINANDIVSNTLTQEQYDLVTNGKPTLCLGTTGTLRGVWLTMREYTNEWQFLRIRDDGQFSIGRIIKSTLSISIASDSILLQPYDNRISSLKMVNGKTIPDYPTTNEFEALLGIGANGGNLGFSSDYYSMFNPNEASANDEIKWSKMLTFSKSADTTFTFETAKTNCLNEYKAIITNSGASTITITLPSGTTIASNDDNIVVSSNTFTLPSGVSVELNCVNSNCAIINWQAQ